MLVDAGKGFVGPELKLIAQRLGIFIESGPTDAQWKNGAAERHVNVLNIMLLNSWRLQMPWNVLRC